MRAKRERDRSIAACLALFLFLSVVGPFALTARAAGESELKTVRVGMDNSDLFITKDSSGKPISGYAYEYIQYLASYANWRVEYVPMGGFAECMQALADGKVDLLYDISYTEERAQQLLYPASPMGSEEYYLFCLADNADFSSYDLSSLTGKKVGVTASTTERQILAQWCEENEIRLKIVEFASIPEKEAALERGLIDLNLEISMLVRDQYSALTKISESSFYLVAASDRPDLASDINTACQKIDEVNPFFVSNLTQKYFGKSILNRTLSADERSWVEQHRSLKVGYMDDYMPLSDQLSDGNPNGIVKDIVPKLLHNLNLEDELPVEYFAYTDNTQMLSALAEGRIDMVFPVLSSLEFGANHAVSISSEVINLSADLVYRGHYAEGTTKTIAVNRSNLQQDYYTRIMYSTSDIVYFESIEEALRSVEEGRVGAILLNGLRTSSLLARAEYSHLSSLRLSQTFSLSFGVREGNSGLLSLLNRCISSMDKSFAYNYAFDYIGLEETDPFTNFITEHRDTLTLSLFAVLFFILVAVILVAVRLAKNRRQLAEANAAKTRFLSNMSHDIRTPLNAIMGFTEIASRNMGDDEMVEDCLHKTRQSSNLLLSLINNVLEMSSIESGKATLQELPGKVSLSFSNIEATMMELANEKDIYLSFEFGEITDRYVYADFEKVNRIFINLISNAIKYTRPGGRVWVKCEQAGREGNKGIYRYTVRDNGIGMSEEYQNTLFEDFNREMKPGSLFVQGSGLGLSVVKSLVDLHHGSIECESTQDKGSCFTLLLPFRLQGEDETPHYVEPMTQKLVDVHAEDKRKAEYDMLGKRILVVEDNELNREIAFYLLSEEGMIVEEADDGTTAVDLLRKKGCNYYDAVLMDIQMLRMDGYEATRAIRKLYPEGKPPIIAVSANAFAEDKAASLAAGMNGHISKPIDTRELFELLAKLL